MQMNYVKDLQSEVVLNNATRKLPFNMMTKCLTCVRPSENYHIGLEAFSSWLREVAAVQEDNLVSGHHNPEKQNGQTKKKPKAPQFQHQQQTPRKIIRRISESVF